EAEVMILNWKCLLGLVILLFIPKKIKGRRIPIVEFQVSGTASTASWLLYNNTVPNMTAFSVCLRTKLIQDRDINVVMSYAVENSDNELYIGLKFSSQVLAFGCCNFTVDLEIPFKIILHQWLSFCLTIDLSKLVYTLLSTDQDESKSFESSSINKDLQVQGGGLLYIGQEQDAYGGSFNPKQSLRGHVADYVMINGLIKETDMLKFIGCDNLLLSEDIVF
ncbi:unnamed protein product, partial [Meganyctiphanes norvegica]